jgi:IS5 family transposase
LPQRLRCPHPFLLNKKLGSGSGPVTKGLENLLNGVKEPSQLKFGFVKLRYRGPKKNANQLFAACALVNLYLLRRRLLLLALA